MRHCERQRNRPASASGNRGSLRQEPPQFEPLLRRWQSNARRGRLRDPRVPPRCRQRRPYSLADTSALLTPPAIRFMPSQRGPSDQARPRGGTVVRRVLGLACGLYLVSHTPDLARVSAAAQPRDETVARPAVSSAPAPSRAAAIVRDADRWRQLIADGEPKLPGVERDVIIVSGQRRNAHTCSGEQGPEVVCESRSKRAPSTARAATSHVPNPLPAASVMGGGIIAQASAGWTGHCHGAVLLLPVATCERLNRPPPA
jgi:hypothetical protein